MQVAPTELTIERAVCQPSTPSSSFDDWNVATFKLSLNITSSIVQVVGLASRTFPSITFLTLTMQGPTDDVAHIVRLALTPPVIFSF